MKNEFPFNDSPNTATFTCTHVLNGERPILHVSHDDDGYWQFLCGGSHTTSDARIISLAEAYDLDRSVGELAEMDYGHCADRSEAGGRWYVK